MNTVLEILKYFETAPLEDAKYASAFLRRIIAGRASEASAAQKRKRSRGWKPKADVYGPGAARQERRERSIVGRTERALAAAGCEMTTREICDAVNGEGDPATMDTVRTMFAKEVKRPEARITRVQDGVYKLRDGIREA